ncbi:MAG: TIGR03086 family metal-binding protein [Acidimicrobiales bacterium]|jgi:uncharacterized protein (TIGR03086 family)
MDADSFQRAVKTSRSFVTSVNPLQLDEATPCRSWRVRDLINHMVDAPTFAARVMETGSWKNGSDVSVDFASGDYVSAYDEATSRAIASFRVDGAMAKVVTLPFGDMPGAVFLNIAVGDAFAHGWDLAKATGHSTDLDPELAAEILQAVRPLLPDQMRGSDGQSPFGPEVEVATDASAADRLAGFLGRHP